MSAAIPIVQHFNAPDCYPLAVRVWENREAWVQVVLLHGIISHSGWYEGSAAQMAAAGLSVHILDRRGAGMNLAARGDVGRYETWCEDVEAYIESLPRDRVTVLAGISWGGKLAMAIARRSRVPLAGLGLICPGLFARQSPNLFQRLAIVLGNAVGLGGVRVSIPLQDPALFTDDPEWQEFLATDPFTLREITLRFALNDLRLTQYATAAPQEVRVPTLLMLGGRDPIIHNDQVRRFVERFDTPHKRIIEYREAGHTLEFEPNAAEMTQDLIAWCQELSK